MMSFLRVALTILCLGLTASQGAAQQHCPDTPLDVPQGGLVIGTKFSPPFVMGPKEAPEGLGIDFWELIADCLDLNPDDYSFVEYGTDADLIAAARDGQVDLAISALPVTAGNETWVDFSYPFFDASLGVIVPDRSRGANFALLISRILHSNILSIVAGLLGFMIFVGLIYWWMERRSGNEFFRQGPLSGLYRSMIWSALLVFQGQGNPFELKSRFGQLFVLLLMFVGVTIISSFTAIITSSLTLQALEPEVNTVGDLEGRAVAVMNQSDSADWAADTNVPVLSMQAFSQVQRYFDEGRIDAFIHEREVLEYLINRRNLTGVKMAPLQVEPKRYAIALPPGSPLREPINLTVLTGIDDPIWQTTLQGYFGSR
ncbi:transporter substrate-binding domain-containing protein [Yoonia sp. BS5-3]|uniref:Transporter substrate-binding domain-containing protein n=1 Tax=Yoonia phaeophyticola TaxID=3137369 RepID=A0ABZ2VA20_9RHOB